jgi:hypothetical protein
MSEERQLDLDDYEAANLLWLLRVAARIRLSTGDWCKQITWKLMQLGDIGEPNWPPSVTDAAVAELTRSSRPALSADEVEAASWLSGHAMCCEPHEYEQRDRALTLLDRLTGGPNNGRP